MKKYFILFFTLVVAVSFAQQFPPRVAGPSKSVNNNNNSYAPVATITVTDLAGAVTPATLVSNILGPTINYVGGSVSYVGTSGVGTSSAGLFSNGTPAGLGFNSGIILSSGYIQNAIGPNSNTGTSANLNKPGDADLNTLIPGYSTNDATILEFDFTTTETAISIQFEFASEEYNEYVGSSYNDVFGFFIDGVNIALVPGTSDPVSVNNVNNGYYSYPPKNSAYYIDNTDGHLDLECDGLTKLLSAVAALDPTITTHHVKLAIADAGDHILDSWVFFKQSGFTGALPINLGDDVKLCEGQTTTLDAGIWAGGSYLWSTGATTQTITVSAAGHYTCTVVTANGAGFDDIDVTEVDLVIDAGENQTVYYGYAPMACATLTCSQPTGGTEPYTYLWNTGATTQSITVCPSETTTYTVTVTDANGCTISDQVKVCVIDVRCGNDFRKVTICHNTPGNTENPQTLCIAASAVPAHLAHGDYLGACGTNPACLNTNQPMGITLNQPIPDEIVMTAVPNPLTSRTTLTFSCPVDGHVTIDLTNLTGSVVSTLFSADVNGFEDNVIELNGSDLAAGLYYCTLRHSDGDFKVLKLIVSK